MESRLARLTPFMDEHVLPAEPVYAEQLRAGQRHPAVMETLKSRARELDLWNLFALGNAEYLPLAEQLGRSPLGPEACNSNAPDSGNMELLRRFATAEQRARWLEPLERGEIRSAFGMTEPDVASSDATNVRLTIREDGDELVLSGRKWWTTGALHPNLRVVVVMGKSDPEAPPHRRQSMVLVPVDTPGMTVVRDLPVFGFRHPEGHGELRFDDVRVPRSHLLGDLGDGFAMAQTRLGPGRVHHCARTIGLMERALELLCRRAAARETFGRRLVDRDNVRDWIAEGRVAITAARALAERCVATMDRDGDKAARHDIAALKLFVPAAAQRLVDRAIQVHGGAGVTEDTPLAAMWTHVRTLRILDGPDEVHQRAVASTELRRLALA